MPLARDFTGKFGKFPLLCSYFVVQRVSNLHELFVFAEDIRFFGADMGVKGEKLGFQLGLKNGHLRFSGRQKLFSLFQLVCMGLYEEKALIVLLDLIFSRLFVRNFTGEKVITFFC